MRGGEFVRVAVIICTWNRARLLDQTLEHLGLMELPPGATWEVLVVNNNCTDDTDAVLARHAGRLPLRRLFEPQPGKAHAANRAIAGTAADLLLWTDDDVHVPVHWLGAYVAAARAWPRAGFFGGPVEPLFSTIPPRWLARHLNVVRAAYAVVDHGPEVRLLRACETVYGANMAVRRSALGESRFDGRLGPCRKTEIRGEESALIECLQAAGHDGVWVGAAPVRHYIPPERLTADYLWRYFVGLGRTEIRTGRALGSGSAGKAPWWALRSLGTAGLQMALFAPLKGRRWLEALRSAAKAWGILQEWRAQTATADSGVQGTLEQARPCN
jgi:glycosyltransferase involved in cell wall biosynthesis